MINGFEEETQPLSASEQLMVGPIVEGLKTKVGKENAVTSERAIEGMRKRGHKIDGARFRKIINYIRVNGLVKRLVATSVGYYIEPDDQELNLYIQGLYQRSDAILSVAEALTKQIME